MRESNFIQYEELEKTPDKRRVKNKHRGLSWYLKIFLIFFFILWFSASAYGTEKFVSGTLAGKESLLAAQTAAVELDIPTVKLELETAQECFSEARSGLVWLGWFKAIPWFRNQYSALIIVMDAGIEALEALEEASEIADDVVAIFAEAEEILAEADVPPDEYTFNNFPEASREKLLTALAQQHNRLVEMQVRLDLTREHLEKLDELQGVSPLILNTVDSFRELLPNILAGVDLLVPLSASVNELAGVDEEKQWLILFLNNTEMRPAGGFMGVFGLMTVKNGEIKSMNVADTYSIDKLVEDKTDQLPRAPQPITDHLGTEAWYFRDANWSPDFSLSAQEAIDLLQLETKVSGQPAPHIDGVIGITPTTAEAMLELLGPTTVDGLEFNHENITNLLEFEVEFGYADKGIDFDQRKILVGKLAENLIEKIYELPVTEWGALLQTVEDQINQKQLAFYSLDQKTQAAFNDAGWSGIVEVPKNSDFLMLVDANMHALKTDAVIDRSIKYSIFPTGDGYKAKVEATYTHFGSYDLFTSDYKAYTRLFVPEGSYLVENTEFDVQNELGLTSFGTYFEIKPGETKTISFEYQLPDSITQIIDKNYYNLLVQKQLGADNFSLTLDLNFDKKVSRAKPAEEVEDFGDNRYNLNTNLVHSISVTVQF